MNAFFSFFFHRQQHQLLFNACVSVSCNALQLLQVSANAGSTFEQHLQKTGNTKFLQLLKSLGVTIGDSKITGTMLVPSDKAIADFAKKMGLTEKELLARPGLVDQLLAYHFMPQYAINSTANIPAHGTTKSTKGISGRCLRYAVLPCKYVGRAMYRMLRT